MSAPVAFVEIWRGPFLESVHNGHAVVCHSDGEIVLSHGDPEQLVLPRSSAKMIQALPLIESGAARQFSLTQQQLALSCASHQGAEIHVTGVSKWLTDLGLSETDLMCGPETTRDPEFYRQMIRSDQTTTQLHNNCSGKHAGFLTLNRHLGGNREYIAVDHPVQQAAREAWERMTEETVAGYGVDGCSAPNFATSIHGVARAMAKFAGADADSAAGQLVRAMATHPELVAGDGRACTNLMRAMDGRVVVKTGAEGFFTAIIPDKKLGIALKISDGATRASECAIVALLVKLNVLDRDHPEAHKYLNAEITSRRGLHAGWQRAAPPLC